MPTTPILGLRYPQLSDPANIPQDIQNLATDVEGAFSPDVVNAGNLGATYSLNLQSHSEVWLVGTLNANTTITVTGLTPGATIRLFLTQDATGNRTVQVSDGVTPVAVVVDNTALASSAVDIFSPNGTSLIVLGGAQFDLSPFGDGIVYTPGFLPHQITGATTLNANMLYGYRWRIPKTGTLASISAVIGTSSGNYDLAIFAPTATRTFLYHKGSTACPTGGNVWRELATPALAVQQGQYIDVTIALDNATASIGRLANGPLLGDLFTGYTPSSGALPKWVFRSSASDKFPIPDNITEATFSTTSVPGLVLVGRIT